MTNIMSIEAAVRATALDQSWPMAVLARPRVAPVFGANAHKTYTSAQGYPPRGLPPA